MPTTKTMPTSDPTLDPSLTSWIDSANGHGEFPIQNLPFGVFRRARPGDEPRIGIAIGDRILDMAACVEAKVLEGLTPEAAGPLSATSLNQFMGQGRRTWSAVRGAASRLLAADTTTLRDDDALQAKCLVAMDDAEPLVPAVIGDYTDFYASVHHATNVGSMFRPDNPLLPNYKHLPVGYHGRSSSIVASGTPVRRPKGQTKADDAAAPTYGPSRLLDYELEMGFFVGPGNTMGETVTMAEALDHIFGMVIRQRLVRPRRAEVGVPAAGTVQRQELRHDGEPLGGHARRPGAVSRPGAATRRRRSAVA